VPVYKSAVIKATMVDLLFFEGDFYSYTLRRPNGHG